MTMTVLAICTSALYELGQPVPSTLLGTSPSSAQLRNIIEAQSRQLRNKRTFPQQKKSYSFDLVSGQYKYPLPQDYYSPLLDTWWDDDLRLRMLGPLGDAAWTDRTKGLSATTPEVGFRIFGPDSNIHSAGGQLQVHPTPTASGETLSFEYISKNLFLPKDWTPSTAGFTTNVYVNANGNIYICSAITTGTTGTTAPSHTSGTAVDGGVTWQYVSSAYESVIANTDLSLFDDDIMVAGVKWRYLKAKSLDYQEEYAAYATMIDQTEARMKGPFIGSFAGTGQRRRRYYVPSGGWSF